MFKLKRPAFLNIRTLIVVLVIVGYILLFRIPFFFTPLRQVPDRIEVYRYGETVTLTPFYQNGSINWNFYTVYNLLKFHGTGSLSRYPENLIYDSLRGSRASYAEDYMKEGLAVRVVYDEPQEGEYTRYTSVIYLMDLPEDKLPTNEAGQPLPLNSEGGPFAYCIYPDEDGVMRYVGLDHHSNPILALWYIKLMGIL